MHAQIHRWPKGRVLLSLGVLLAMGVLWIRQGGIFTKIGWSIMFVVGGHPSVAIWLGVQLLTGRVQMKTE